MNGIAKAIAARVSGIRGVVTLGALVAVNAVPLVGALFWRWDVGSIVILYWSENLVIGFYTIVKMLERQPLRGLAASAFFLIHYGGFCAVHGFFVLALTGHTSRETLLDDPQWPFVLVFVELLYSVVRQVLSIAPAEWLVGFLALFVSHGLSLALNYFGRGEFREQSPKSIMMAPYKRIVVLHVAILAGGFGIATLGSPLPLLVLLVVSKTGLDVWLHLRERRTQAPAGDPSGSVPRGAQAPETFRH